MLRNFKWNVGAFVAVASLAIGVGATFAGHDSRASVRREVRRASNAWIANFNAGNVDGVANAYLENATMWAEPVGIFVGRPDIRTFWNNLINDPVNPARKIRYRKRRIRVLSDTVAIVTADWRMNIGSGVIYQEKWVKQQGTGDWKLLSDHFDILATFN